MRKVTFGNKTYTVDAGGFLLNGQEWDEQFAEGAAADAMIPDGLTADHWTVIHFVRTAFRENGLCPLVYQTCGECGLDLSELRRLFPSGYLRGVCKLAGITYKDSYLQHLERTSYPSGSAATEKTYRVDVSGFLVDPSEWDDAFALQKAHEMKMPAGLTDEHWRVIRFLRDAWHSRRDIPTVYDTCETLGLDLDGLYRLFPDGYHRGAVKLAGLRVR